MTDIRRLSLCSAVVACFAVVIVVSFNFDRPAPQHFVKVPGCRYLPECMANLSLKGCRNWRFYDNPKQARRWVCMRKNREPKFRDNFEECQPLDECLEAGLDSSNTEDHGPCFWEFIVKHWAGYLCKRIERDTRLDFESGPLG